MRISRAVLSCGVAGLVLFGSSVAAQTLVSTHGRLRSSGNRIINQHGAQVSFAGVSMYWSEPTWGNPTRFWNASVVNWLASDWNAQVIRLPVSPGEDGGQPDGWMKNPALQRQLIDTMVNACVARGVYVIIDWHAHNAHQNEAAATNFFREMVDKYGQHDAVLWEIWNEPKNDVTWTGNVKPYAERVIDVIRNEKGNQNLIIVGNPVWDQNLDEVAASPIQGRTNLAYAFHFYEGQHDFAFLTGKAQAALNANLAVFASEWGTWFGGNFAGAGKWYEWLRARGISHCIWELQDNGEVPAILRAGASSNGGWDSGQLTDWGNGMRGVIRGWVPPIATPTATTAARPTATPAGNLISQGRPVTASSQESASTGPGNAVDGLMSTRWSSAFSDPQWIRVDLGANAAVSRVVLHWEAAYGTAYQIQISSNDTTWTTLFSTTSGNGAIDDLAVSGTGRYVRMNGTGRATQYGYSLWELQIYGTVSGPTPTTTSRPRATPTFTPTAAARPTATPSGGIVSGAFYTVRNQASGKCVDAAAASTANGTVVQQYTCNGTNAQQWQFTTTDGGYYRVGSRNATVQAWDVAGGTGDAAKIQLWTYGGGSNQQWQPVALGGGYYRLIARHSGKCLDVPAASTADGVQLQQYTCNGTAAQSFLLTQQ